MKGPAWFTPGAVTALAIVLQPLIWAGPGGRLPWSLLGWERGAAIGWAVLALGFVLFGRALGAFLEARWPLVEKGAIALLLAAPPLTALFDVASWIHFERFGYRFPLPLLVLDAAVLAALVAWVRGGRPAGAGAVVATLGATMHRALSIVLFPLDGRRSDMLNSILHGHALWSQGTSPYAQQPNLGAGAASWGIMPYLPGTFLAHAPSAWTGLDARWLGTGLLLAIGAGSVLLLRRSAGHPAAGGEAVRGAELLAALVLLSPYQAFRHELYFDFFLLLTVTAFAWVAWRGPLRTGPLLLCGALVGLACASRQWAWIYGPFVLVAASGGTGWRFARRLALAGAAAAATAALVVAPFVLRDPAAFVGAVLYHANAPGGELSLGVAVAAEPLHLVRFLQAAAAAFVAVALGACLAGVSRGRIGPEAVLSTGWVVLVAAVLLGPFLENYFHLTPSFAAVGLALGCAARETDGTG